ncbi:MAG: hypothetical protein AAFQ87_11790 [Bacteroidota bacterium]
MSNALLPYTARNYFRNVLGKYSLIGRRRPDLAYRKGRNLCIEGFPRSANTYGVLLVEKFAVQELSIAHHLHLPIQLKRAVQDDVPAVLIIREPMAAITSLLLREEKVSIWSAFHWYNSFHESLLPIKDDLIIWTFEQVIKEPLWCIADLEAKTGLVSLAGKTEVDNEAIFEEIDRLDKFEKADSNLQHVNSRPNAEKAKAKKALKDQILNDPRWESHRKQAQKHYQFFTS